MGKIQKVGRWVPHELVKDNLGQRISTCEKKNFLWKFVTGDEKYIFLLIPNAKSHRVHNIPDNHRHPFPNKKST